MTWQKYAIVTGHDNQESVVNVETITPIDDYRPFCTPSGWGNFDPGIERIRGDGSITHAGKKRTRWIFSVMTPLQYNYALDNWEGPVTLYTRTNLDDYAYYNAMGHVPKLTEQQKGWMVLFDIPIEFTDLVEIAAP